jgi:hypothetical protein
MGECALKMANGDRITAYNLQFRGGPCDICGGDCFCKNDEDLLTRIMSGLKPIGTFPFTSKKNALNFKKEIEEKGLTTYMKKNKWNMWTIVATIVPDKNIEGIGTPREKAFRMEFINEEDTFVERGALYGYPRHLSEILDNIT